MRLMLVHEEWLVLSCWWASNVAHMARTVIARMRHHCTSSHCMRHRYPGLETDIGELHADRQQLIELIEEKDAQLADMESRLLVRACVYLRVCICVCVFAFAFAFVCVCVCVRV